MRISDWSSDVCSSDLPRGRTHQTLGRSAACHARNSRHQAVRAGFGRSSYVLPWRGLLGLSAENFHGFQGDKPDVRDVIERCDEASQLGFVVDNLDNEGTAILENAALVDVCRSAEPQPGFKNRDACQARVPPAGSNDINNPARSEEHKSEIQSLIRTAHTVF